VALLLKALAEKENGLWTTNLVLAGDFNLYDSDVDTIALFNAAGYTEVGGLLGQRTNVSETEAYDRLFVRKNSYFEIAKDNQGVEIGNVFKPFEYVFREDEHVEYKDFMLAVYGGGKDLANDANALEDYFNRYWKRNQISDHNPIWFEISTDSSHRFLASKMRGFDALP